jgi:hypothetical protein
LRNSDIPNSPVEEQFAIYPSFFSENGLLLSLVPQLRNIDVPNSPLWISLLLGLVYSDEERPATTRKKKFREFPVPSRDVTTKLSLGGNNDVITELFLPRGGLVADIPAGDGKLVKLFYGVSLVCLLSIKKPEGQEFCRISISSSANY